MWMKRNSSLSVYDRINRLCVFDSASNQPGGVQRALYFLARLFRALEQA